MSLRTAGQGVGPGHAQARENRVFVEGPGRGAVRLARGPAQDAVERSEPKAWRARYLIALTWAFTLLNAARVLSYLPTLWALTQSGDSSQHSLWTWGMWTGANVTMAAWLYEQQDQRWNRAITINIVNAWMCASTFVVIAALRL